MRSVGMKKQKWFKTAGVVAFAAQLLGAGGLARATNNACFPQPRFVYGGDPKLDSLTVDNLARWTGSSGFGWANGAGSEVSYEGALVNNPLYPDTTHPDIGPQQLLLAFERQIPLSKVFSAEGVRLGFNFTYTDHAGTSKAGSQIIVVNFDASDHSPTWNVTPPPCATAAAGARCYNDRTSGDPATFVSFQPTFVQLLQKADDGKTDVWPANGDITGWVKNNTRVWIFADKNSTGGITGYYWRMQMALPIRSKTYGATAPDPGVVDSWTSPSIYLDDTVFSSTAKTTPKFWVDFITATTDLAQVTYHPYPDTTNLNDPTQRPGPYQVPSTTLWGTGEVGSPRDAALLVPGELHCSGTGIAIEASTADSVVWHSDIWNTTAGMNSAGVFDDGGKLYMVDATGAIKSNVIAVKVKNTSTNVVDANALRAQFLIAPYGAQAIGTVWAPLTTGGNDYTCPGGGGATCNPSPTGTTNVILAQAPAGSAPLAQNNTVELDQTGSGWRPSANYMCAVQTKDTTTYDWYYNDPKESVICAGAVYKPTSADGTVANGVGLPGHQCIQAQLSATTSSVQFATKSAFRNMHQGVASMHRETATVDTRGLPKIKGQSYHDIYLYVETHNMPYRVDAGYSPRTYTSAMQIYKRSNYCDGRYCPPGFDPSVPAPSDNFFTKTMPTYIVNAYADTGAKYTTAGRSVPVLHQLTSFGQFISHDATTEGPVFGWDASLEPVAGTQFQKVGANTYRIRIPNDGAGQVVTHVEPLPSKCGRPAPARST